MVHAELGPFTNGLWCWCHQPHHLPRPSSRHLPCQHHFPCHQPCHCPRQFTRHHCHPCHHRVNSHVIIHVINVWHGNSIRDENYAVCDVYFRHRKWAWVGLWGPGDIFWRFQNVMDQAIRDENLRNVTRCNLWRSIHDEIWDCHRYCFMTVF